MKHEKPSVSAYPRREPPAPAQLERYSPSLRSAARALWFDPAPPSRKD